MTEIWKAIKGYEGTYEVSNTGKVRTLKPRTQKHLGPKVLKLQTYTVSQTQYNKIELSNPSKKFLVHRLVAEAFLPHIEGKDLVNHKDNNGLSNNISNLEWCTQSENLIHAQKQGRLHNAQSKGGKTTTKRAQLTAYNNAQALVGDTINSWTAISYAGKSTTGKEILNCKCTCGYEQVIPALRFSKGQATNCRKCAKTKQREARYNELVDTYLSTNVGTWNITAVSVFIPDDSVRSMKFFGECKECSHKSILTQPSVIGTRPLKPCPVCKDRNNLKI